jgi:anti-sigma B factor antagonist
MRDMLQIAVTETTTSVVLRLRGELDASTAPQLRHQVLEQMESGRRVIIDTTELQFCGSSGLAVLVEAHQRALAHGPQLRIVVQSASSLQRVLRLVGLNNVLPIVPDLDAALN